MTRVLTCRLPFRSWRSTYDLVLALRKLDFAHEGFAHLHGLGTLLELLRADIYFKDRTHNDSVKFPLPRISRPCHRQGGQEIRQRSGTQTLFSLIVASHILPTSVAPLCPLKKLRYGPLPGRQRRAVPRSEGPEYRLGSGLVAFARRTFCQHHRWRRRRQRKRCLAARWQRQQRIGR